MARFAFGAKCGIPGNPGAAAGCCPDALRSCVRRDASAAPPRLTPLLNRKCRRDCWRAYSWKGFIGLPFSTTLFTRLVMLFASRKSQPSRLPLRFGHADQNAHEGIGLLVEILVQIHPDLVPLQFEKLP